MIDISTHEYSAYCAAICKVKYEYIDFKPISCCQVKNAIV